ncbi:cyclin-dependent kinase F-3-like [Pyrus x bretschneideri]|uniref:cyclin-dependent kinase F-3-like n=1 Tax=Pyrus x bretschneideri TaxID=225117 RepID=UPI0020300E86|nr:cyclin-dependent kinase F-3-like [Pyrus x bretschneideri]
MQSSLLDHMVKRQTKFTEDEVRSISFQMFHGLDYMHRNGYFHRDLKPANVLVNDGSHVVKIADLGSAMEIDSPPPYTDYVTTRPYRAPEVLLQSGLYGPKVDMWAMGAIIAELFSFRTLFPGQSADDQMFKICSVIGSPTWDTWPEGHILAQNLNYEFPQFRSVGLSVMVPSASRSTI